MKRSSLGVYQFNQAVGAVVVLCFVLFVAALVNAGLLKEWFERSLTLRVVLPDSGAPGLAPGAAVEVMGTRAGEVRRIVIDPTQRMHAELRVDQQMKTFIRRDSVVTIRRQFGIAGNSYVDIARGNGPELDWQFAVLSAASDRAPTDTISQMVDDVNARIAPMMDEAQKAIVQFNALLVPLQQTVESVSVMARRLERGEGTAGRFLADEKTANDVQRLLAETQSTIARANNVMADLEQAARDPRIGAIVQRTEAVLGSLQSVTRDLAAASPQVGKLTTSVAGATDSMPALLLQTESAARELELLLGQLRRSWLLGGTAAPPAGRRAPAGEVRP